MSVLAWAQDRIVTGKVTSADDGSSLPGVNVVLKGTTSGSVTDVDGNYSISVPSAGGTLVFTFIGLRSIEVETGTRSQVNVQMQVDVTQLTEVIVTGYASQEKRTVTGAISSVKGDDIENLPLQSFDRAIQGRAAGVMVLSNNGIPGGAVNVRIRGTGSISAGNDPLYIVDGVQLNSRSDALYTQSNPLSFLNPNDIESIEILKDAASAAIYGSQAANGVVIITTKKGKKGKAKFNFNTYFGTSEPLKKLETLNSQEWFQMRREARLNAGQNMLVATHNTLNDMGVRPADFNTTTPNYTQEQLDEIAANLQTYDWQDEAMRDGKVQNYELSISGGDDKTNFYLSGSYSKQEAIVKPIDFQRGTVNMKVGHKATEKLEIGASVNLSTFSQNVPFSVDGSFLGSPAFAVSTILPHNRIYNEDGSFNTSILGVLNQNPIAVLNWNSGVTTTNQTVGNLNFSYKILDGLTFRSLWGVDHRFLKGDRYTDPRTPDGAGVLGRGAIQSYTNTNFISTQTLNYVKSFDVHNLSVLVGGEYRSDVSEGMSGTGIGFPSFQFRTIQSAATPEGITSFWGGFKRVGVFGRVNYDYNKKYLLAFTGRYDGSSKFGANNKFGFFPSAEVGWVAKEESFLRDVNAVSELKLRASYGQTGNDDFFAVGVDSRYYPSQGLYGAAGNYNSQGGIRPTGLAYPDLKWERNITFNVGVDFGFFNNRLTGAVDAFERTSKDLLLAQPVLFTSGYSTITTNVGELVNRGLEIELRSINVDNDLLKWESSFNITFLKNEVTKLYGDLKELPGDPSVRVGESLGTHFTQRFAGVNPATGRPMWYDINGNPKYQVVAGDRVVAGNSLPEYYGGLNNTITIKRFEFTFFFQYEYGRVVSDGQVGFLRENGTRLTLNALRETAEARWTSPGQITHIQRPYLNGPEPRGSGVNTGTTNLQKADYIRLKQISLAYNFNPSLLTKLKISNAKIYAQGLNLWTYDDYLGYDPEWVGSISPTTGANGGAIGIVPQLKSYTIGLQLSF